jgi:Ca2+-transporting ATPase
VRRDQSPYPALKPARAPLGNRPARLWQRAMSGLSTSEALARLARDGPNALPAPPAVPWWRRFGEQFASPLVVLLLGALAVDLTVWGWHGALGWPVEALAIAVILLLNAGLGLYQERRSEAALAHLATLAAAQAWVLRDGQLCRLPGRDLVEGDRVRLEAGDRIPADGIFVEAVGALVDEGVLTGESLPVDKLVGDVAASGTLLVRGRGWLEVTRTGAASAMGRLATMLGSIEAAPTPLERRVAGLGRQIARWVLGLAVALGVAGVAAEGIASAPQMVVFAVALAVAAVPEGLPAVLTVALALGVERMARRQAVVRRLNAVEALGSVTVIATDKTGTLTESRMEVRSLDATDQPRALVAMACCNEGDLAQAAGDPLDLGLLRFVAKLGGDPAALRARRPVVSERPFDSAWKFARVSVEEAGAVVSYLKGAPEVLLARSRLAAAAALSWRQKADAYAAEGFRVLALAWGPGEREDGLELLGLVLFWDPPRPEVPAAVAAAQAAGIRVLLVTGDHPATALAVARQIGIGGVEVLSGEDLDACDDATLAVRLREVAVFARVRPEQKLRLVEALQAAGEVVAVTGDGVNDAPALKRSDVGTAMGQRGSDVSREVADLVLLDDNFATIVAAVEQGREIYENIQKFLRFLFSTNLSEVLLVAAGAVLAWAYGMRDAGGALLLPLTAAQILWINLATDGLPALALALDRTPGVMRQPPRPPGSPLLDRPSLHFVVAVGVAKAALALLLLTWLPWLGHPTEVARAVVFHFMAIGQLLLTYPARHTATYPRPNPFLHGAVAVGIALQLLVASWPWSAALLGGAALPVELWAVVFAASALGWLVAEVIARVVWSRSARRVPAG